MKNIHAVMAAVQVAAAFCPNIALAQISQEDVLEATQRGQEEQEQLQQEPLAQEEPLIPESAIIACTALLQNELFNSILPRCDHDILYFKGLCETTNNTEKYCFNFDMDRYLNIRGISDAARPPVSFCNMYNDTKTCEF